MNIFARELAQALADHDKELSSLYSIKSEVLAIHPGKVTRLKRSLVRDQTATLNADELELLRQRIPLTEVELRRLRAALVAETVRYMLSGRMEVDHAEQVAELTFELLVAEDGGQMSALRDTVLEQIRAGSTADAPGAEDPIERALEAATNEYVAGTLWLEMARDTRERSTRLGFLAQAESLLTHAHKLATHPASVALGSAQQAELLQLIEVTLAEIDLLR